LDRIKLHKKYKPLWEADYDYCIVTGGRGSSKSFSVGDFIENLSFEAGHVILFTRYTLTSAHLSIIPEFQEKIDLENHVKYFSSSKTEILNTRSGSRILFRGIKTGAGIQTAALKSIQGLSTWILDEAEELVDEDIFDKIDESVRQKGIKNRIIIILNPASKTHWIYKRWFEQAGVNAGWNGIKNRVLYIHTDYRDNIGNLSDKFILRVKQLQQTNPEKYKHRILGGWLEKPDGVIYPNWKLGTFDDTIPYGFGLDFGFSIDPDALVKVAVDKKRKRIYLKELMYRTGQSTSQLIAILKKYIAPLEIIIADSAEGRLINDIRNSSFNIKPTKKKQGSVIEGIKIVQDYELIIDEESTNLVKELNNYAWHDKRSETPIDAYNHCFVGNTLIKTFSIEKRISEIQEGEIVQTTFGYNKVLKVFNNGVKQIVSYKMQFDTFSLSLQCTPDHKIKTTQGWIEISKLKEGHQLFLHKNLTAKYITNTTEKNITQKGQTGFMSKFGNIITGMLLKVIMFTIKTEIGIITKLVISNASQQKSILENMKASGQVNFLESVKKTWTELDRLQKLGMPQNLEETGIQNTEQRHGSTDHIFQKYAFNAEKNTQQDMPVCQNTAIRIVKLNRLEIEGSWKEKVYDLEIAKNHEYIANGVVVHNCLDAIRYYVQYITTNVGIYHIH